MTCLPLLALLAGALSHHEEQFVRISREQTHTLAYTFDLHSVVMPHNLYLHTAACQSRRVKRTPEVVQQAVHYCTIEPIFPLIFSFFINAAVVAIAAETVQGTELAENVGLTDFCDYFRTLKGGCKFWGMALLAAGQSSAITTTYSGQYVMDGFLQIRLPVWSRAVITRLVAITPCVIVSVMFPSGPALNKIVNIVNSSLSVLLPFALTPLVKVSFRLALSPDLLPMITLNFLFWLLVQLQCCLHG